MAGEQGDRLSFEPLKAKQRAIRGGFPSDLGLRVHRALSWLNRAEMAGDDQDAAFIFYWIAFNAAYAKGIEEAPRTADWKAFTEFFSRITEQDRSHRIYDAIWQRFPRSIRLLLDNRYVLWAFWKHQNQEFGYENWEERFEADNLKIVKARASHDTLTILSTLFGRLYVLRNQLVHGGATWNSKVNRDQVCDGVTILAFLLPLFIDLMMDNPEIEWGPPYYPVIE